jgi:hypothetical protein
VSDRAATCLICGEQVVDWLQDNHLAAKHPPPERHGFKFHIDGKECFSHKPSMEIIAIKTMFKVGGMYQAHVEYKTPHGYTDDYCLSDSQSIDLTNDPWIYFVPPATF